MKIKSSTKENKNLTMATTGFKKLWYGRVGKNIDDTATSKLNELDLDAAIEELQQPIQTILRFFYTAAAVLVALVVLPIDRPLTLALLLSAFEFVMLSLSAYNINYLIKLISRQHAVIFNGEELSFDRSRMQILLEALDRYSLYLKFEFAVYLCTILLSFFAPILHHFATSQSLMSNVTGPFILTKIGLVIIGISISMTTFHGAFISQSMYPDEFNNALETMYYKDGRLEYTLNGTPSKHKANSLLGYTIDNHESELWLDQPVRTLGTIIFGPPGTGKTRTIFKPMIKQDIDKLIEFIRDYQEISQYDNFYSRDVSATYLNSIVVVDPTEDLTNTVYELAREKGIPESLIFYVNPKDPFTPSLDLFTGDTSQIIGKVLGLFQSLSADEGSTNQFFSQSEDAHLTRMIQVCIGANAMRGTKATLKELIDMYQNTAIRDRDIDMFIEYEKQSKKYYRKIKIEYPDSEDDQTEEQRITLKRLSTELEVIDQTSKWLYSSFPKMTVEIQPGVRVPDMHTERGYESTQKRFDMNLNNIQGLVNKMTFVVANERLRNVLMQESQFIDIDKVFKHGGIVLFNLDHSGLGEANSSAFGKIVQDYLIEGMHRRDANVSPTAAVYMDEVASYMTSNLAKTPTQVRKFGIALHLAFQAPSQIISRFDKEEYENLVTACRTRISYGDTSPENAKMISDIFGEHVEFTEKLSSWGDDFIMTNESNRQSSMVSVDEHVPNITPSKLASLESNTIAVRYPLTERSNLFELVKQRNLDGVDTENRLDISNPESFDAKAFEYFKEESNRSVNVDFGPSQMIADYLLKSDKTVNFVPTIIDNYSIKPSETSKAKIKNPTKVKDQKAEDSMPEDLKRKLANANETDTTSAKGKKSTKRKSKTSKKATSQPNSKPRPEEPELDKNAIRAEDALKDLLTAAPAYGELTDDDINSMPVPDETEMDDESLAMDPRNLLAQDKYDHSTDDWENIGTIDDDDGQVKW
ncbi:type IV secretory pathway TraG/TraD family ATPase VirD4 [Weissella uvarum]|uniref:type IV secretory system conjugative DNA transfer family protein n=1 Tax=Weissella uvarum TaxID=1479233 RepID=UPI0019608BB7|nr:TraM recognition domain-containing protein [Weissella uvarum]MBM7617886.1 type IV secretory pathway TraG/TraD family ATPase VirD4 [Weissella uvarum]MCM0596116.1 TraM recognition domain-containing protein [Weissella uvarum]